MSDVVQFAVLVPESVGKELAEDTRAFVRQLGDQAHESIDANDVTVTTKEALKTESALGFDPILTPTLVWAAVKFTGSAVAGGALKAAGGYIFAKLKGVSNNKAMLEMTVRLPDGTRISVKGDDPAALVEFAKVVKVRQSGRRV